MTGRYLSTFTPSLDDPETLEALFVSREDLARRLMDRIRESATTGNKHYALLIGPRGIGKTHLVALLYHRIRQDQDLDPLLRIAWLEEDPWPIDSYRGLLLMILHQLRQEYGLADLDSRCEALLDLEADEAEVAAEQLLLETIGEKTLLLIVENLDDVFRGLGTDGQSKLRAAIQNHPVFTILATSTSLFKDVSARKKLFYGFFATNFLHPLDLDQAVQLLARIAEYQHNIELARIIRSATGRARIRAIHFLAGGNPRIYVVFHQFLTRESLDQLVPPFMKLLDEMTPYYQARLSTLAPLQRVIVDILRKARGAIPVKEIARSSFRSPQTISTQLKQLRELGYVQQAASLGKESYYELREPLMRLCLEVKGLRGRMVPLFVEFLRVWYSGQELREEFDVSSPIGHLEKAHLQEALAIAKEEPDPLVPSIQQDFYKHQVAGDHERALEMAEELIYREPENKDHWYKKASCLMESGSPEEELACWRMIAELDPEDSTAWNWQDVVLVQMGKFEEALGASRRALELEPESSVFNANYGRNLKRQGKTEDARAYLEKGVSLLDEPKTAEQWRRKGKILYELKRYDDALRAYEEAVELDPRLRQTWEYLISLVDERSHFDAAIKLVERALEILPTEAGLWSRAGAVYSRRGQLDDTLTAYDKVVELDRNMAHAWTNRGTTLSCLGQHSQALESLERSRELRPEGFGFRGCAGHANELMLLGRWEEGIAELGDALEHFGQEPRDGDELQIITGLMLRTQNPDIWRRYIQTWLDLFQRHGLLTLLGQGVVHKIRYLAIPWFSQEAAQSWYETWQELAGGYEEMELPLTLLSAAVAYRASRDRRVLLRLPQEQRNLLEPLILNLTPAEDREPDEIDRMVDDLLEAVDRRLADQPLDPPKGTA